MRIKTTGIVLKEQTISEKDKLLTLLTLEKGVIRAFARGAKSPKSRINSGSQQFCYCDFDIYVGSNTFSVEGAEVIESFFGLRKDFHRVALAQYFCELMMELAPREENSEEYLKLILNANYLLMTGKKDKDLIKSVFELRLIVLSGYMPNIYACSECGEFESELMYFDIGKGNLYFDKCNKNKYNIPVSLSVVTAMRHVAFCDKEKVFSFTLSASALKDLSEISERYLLQLTMRNYKTLDFYKMF